MKIKRPAAVLGLAVAAALALSACGSDENTPSGSSPTSAGGDDAAAVQVDCGGKKALSASGATSQTNAMTRYVTAYEATCDGYTLNYNANGSGAGIKDFNGKQSDFAGSDSPLNKDKGEVDAAKTRCGSDAWNLPTVFGPIAITYNVSGADGIALDGPALAKIFQGQVSTWNDPAIAALNSGKTLPGDKIVVIFRSDESGTTDNFQKYLKTASKGAWAKETGKVFNGGVGEGAKGNEGTSAAVKSTPGAITYNEWSFAKQQKLQIAKIVNSGGGEAVELTTDSAGKSIEEAKLKGSGNDLVLDLDSIYGASAAGAYPIVLATYEIVCSKYPDAEVAKAVKAFLTVAATDGQKGLADNGYIPMPKSFQEKLLNSVAAIS